MSTPRHLVHWLARAACVSLVLASPAACSAPERLGAVSERVLALREISGLATGTLPDRGPVVAAVGDEARAVTLVPMGADGPDLGRAVVVTLPLPELAGGSQLEAVAIAKDHVFVLSEGATPTLTEVALAPDAIDGRLVATAPLEVRPDHRSRPPGARTRTSAARASSSRTHACSSPSRRTRPAIIAFSKVGDAWVAGVWWSLDAPDVSDLARGPDGSLYMIGAAAESICRLAPLPPEGGAVGCEARWGLPEDLGKGKTQWEGLAFLPDGRPLVAVDRKKHDTPNLAILPRLERRP